MASFAEANHIPIVPLKAADRNIEVMRPYLGRAAETGRSQLAAALDAWLAVRRTWPAAKDNPAVFLNRAGARMSLRTADDLDAAIGRLAVDG